MVSKYRDILEPPISQRPPSPVQTIQTNGANLRPGSPSGKSYHRAKNRSTDISSVSKKSRKNSLIGLQLYVYMIVKLALTRFYQRIKYLIVNAGTPKICVKIFFSYFTWCSKLRKLFAQIFELLVSIIVLPMKNPSTSHIILIVIMIFV